MSIEKFDYEEPACPLSGGKEFYYPEEKPAESIPIRSVIGKFDAAASREDYAECDRLLGYWLAEARALGDRRGELSLLSEAAGLYRKINDRERALKTVDDCLKLLESGEFSGLISTGDMYINCATTLSAFGLAERSLEYFDRALAIYEAELPAGHEMFAAYYNNRGLALSFLGRYAEARDCFFRAADILSKIEARRLDLAITHLNIADTFVEDAELDDREGCVERARSLIEDPEVKRDAYYAFVCRKCAPAFRHYGYFAYARQLNERADSIYEGN